MMCNWILQYQVQSSFQELWRGNQVRILSELVTVCGERASITIAWPIKMWEGEVSIDLQVRKPAWYMRCAPDTAQTSRRIIRQNYERKYDPVKVSAMGSSHCFFVKKPIYIKNDGWALSKKKYTILTSTNSAGTDNVNTGRISDSRWRHKNLKMQNFYYSEVLYFFTFSSYSSWLLM